MQTKSKIALGGAAIAVLVAVGAGLALADGQDQMGMGHHKGRMGMMGGDMQGQMGMMNGPMGGMMQGHMGMMGMMEPRVDFAAADADKDGKLTADELTAWRAAQVKSIDANGDGKLSADEISAFAIAQISPRIEERVTVMVTRLDTDGDQLLSAAELLARPLATPDFQRLDRNGDGSVTPDELAPPAGRGPAPQGAEAPPADTAPSGN